MKTFTVILLFFVISGCSDKQKEQKESQGVLRLDKPGTIYKPGDNSHTNNIANFINKFTSAAEPLILPLPKADIDKFDISDELVKMDSVTFNQFVQLENVTDPLECFGNVTGNVYYYYKVEFKNKIVCPVIFTENEQGKFLILLSGIKDMKFTRGLVIAGNSESFSFDADIENNKVAVSDGKKKFTYALNENGEFNRQ